MEKSLDTIWISNMKLHVNRPSIEDMNDIHDNNQ